MTVRGAMDKIGAYSWHPSSDRWIWNDTMFHLLGYASGEVRPSRALVVAHKHPDDRAHVERIMADAVAHRLAYTCRHRIVSVDGTIHQVVAVGHPADHDERWPPGLLLRGYLVHLATTAPRPSSAEFTATASVGIPTAPFPRGDPQGRLPSLGSSWSAAEHDRHVGRAADVLADAMELTSEAGAALLAHLANAAAEPLIVVAERVIAVSLDPDTRGLAELLTGIAVPEA
ncbi:PAS domain-containing protein [Actinomycetospora endophytica]|uniref:PAS domain-containing protein n=1 Tax=Actinomycetospora endophytica TaxID=2291215 RepID=A0ABS8PAS9_9PSEU|nr:PAS domain-containing protein [Actinomycetospora endophytica]MCD2194531.1 PAS domain-containing protein [Actinomycetospora endophytica]